MQGLGAGRWHVKEQTCLSTEEFEPTPSQPAVFQVVLPLLLCVLHLLNAREEGLLVAAIGALLFIQIAEH